MARGGYRKPSNPAPVSGPGALSRRTDGGPAQGAKEMAAGGKYGERKALREMQQAAPMQGNPVPVTPASSIKVPRQPVTNLFAPTERPQEPITAGAPVGPGRTPEEPMPEGRYRYISKYMPVLREAMKDPDVPNSFKIFMRYVDAANRIDTRSFDNNVIG